MAGIKPKVNKTRGTVVAEIQPIPGVRSGDRGRKPPPEEHQWKQRISGNPRGRPKKQDSLTSLLKEEIENTCPADRQQRTYRQLVVVATLRLALKGNATASMRNEPEDTGSGSTET
jgi:hypothetical protein